jgi:hypothetical protein
MKVKYLNKDMLRQINSVSTRIGYNRTLPEGVIESLSDDRFFVVIPLMVHEHIMGRAAEPHMRCRIYAGDENPWLILDVNMAIYEFIPEHEVEDNERDQPENSEPEVAAT